MATERDINVRVRLRGANEFRAGMRGVNTDLSSMSGWMDVTKGILASDILKKGLAAIVNGLKNCYDASVEFESAMAGVAKTTDMSDVQLEAMGQQIMDLSERIPITANELARLAESAGQLGIAGKDILNFTEVMAALGVATNLSADDAATALAQMANIMGTSAKDYERMGSAIVELGNTSATTEADIVSMAQGMAGAGKLVGMAEADVFGFATALSSVGIEAQAGSSSMSKLWSQIETMVALGSDDLDDFAEVASMSAAEFARAWEEDAALAMHAFIQGLGETERTGKSSIAVLSELGITEIRMARAVTSLIGENDLLGKSLETSRRAWEENTALANEASVRYETSASRIQMAENAVENMSAAIGDKFKGAVVGAKEEMASWASEIRKGISDLEDLPKRYAELDEQLAQEQESINAAADQVDVLIGRLEELGAAGELSKAEQMEYLAALRLIKQIMPGVAGVIDVETGAIQGGTEALRENTAAARAMSLQSAEVDVLREKYDAYAQAEQIVADKSALLQVARLELAKAEEEHSAALERGNELAEQAAREAEELSRSGGGFVDADALLEDNEEYQKLDERVREATEALNEADRKVKELSGEIEQNTRYLEENGGVVAEYERALNGMGEALADAGAESEAFTEAQQAQVDGFQAMADRVAALEDELLEAYDAARKQVDGVVAGFGRIEMPEPVGADELLENLQSQIEYMDQYRKNLAKVQEMGLDPKIVEQLSDGSLESAGILAGLVEDGGASIDDLNGKFAEASAGKEQLALAMAEASTDFQARANEITAAMSAMVDDVNQNAAAYTSAASTIQGLINGVNAKIPTLSARVNRVKSLMSQLSGAGSSGGSGSSGGGTPHAAGLTYVPFDEYPAILHRGEMVLTALEARAYRAEQFANYGMIAALERGSTVHNTDNRKSYGGKVDNSVRIGDMYVRTQSDARRMERELAAIGRSRARGIGKRA